MKGPLVSKSFDFGAASYKECAAIWKLQREWILTRQLMRSSTAIGALCAESEHAQSRADFINKLCIARKECNESSYWIAMMLEVGLLNSSVADRLQRQADELMRLLTASIKTAQANLKNAKKT